MYQVACVLPLSYTVAKYLQFPLLGRLCKKSALNQTTSLRHTGSQTKMGSLKNLFLYTPGFINAWRCMCRNQKRKSPRARQEITRKVPLWRSLGVFRVLIFVILTWTCVRFLSYPKSAYSSLSYTLHGCCERNMDVCLQGAGDSSAQIKNAPFVLHRVCVLNLCSALYPTMEY